MREKAMPARDVQHAASPAEAPYAPRHLPGFVELLAREAADMTHHATDPIEQRVPGESVEIMRGQPVVRSGSKTHASILPAGYLREIKKECDGTHECVDREGDGHIDNAASMFRCFR